MRTTTGGRSAMSETITYSVPSIHCAHCVMSIEEELSEVAGVDEIAVDLGAKTVRVTGDALSDEKLRAAIRDAGYEAA